jgi:hypothetical protein
MDAEAENPAVAPARYAGLHRGRPRPRVWARQQERKPKVGPGGQAEGGVGAQARRRVGTPASRRRERAAVGGGAAGPAHGARGATGPPQSTSLSPSSASPLVHTAGAGEDEGSGVGEGLAGWRSGWRCRPGG